MVEKKVKMTITKEKDLESSGEIKKTVLDLVKYDEKFKTSPQQNGTLIKVFKKKIKKKVEVLR